MTARILSELVTLKFLLVYLWIGCVCYMHFRGKVRLRFGRQLFEHSGILAPFNALMYAFSAVPRTPMLDVEDFPDLAPLRKNWTVFRDEAQALLDHEKIEGSHRHNDVSFLAFYKRGWKRFYLKWYSDPMPSAQALCPRSGELIQPLPNVNAAAFTLLPPGGTLGKHRDPVAASLRYHLGLITPNSDKCRIWVDGHEHSWRDGEDVVFDETYVHWAENDTDVTRVILFVDFTRPLHTKVMRGFSNFLIKHFWGITRSQNEEGDKVGLINRISPRIYKLKTDLYAFKKRNRRLYYTLKYSLFASVVYLVLLRGVFTA